MTFLDKVQTGVVEQPAMLMLYGTEGVGKTSFAADAPKPIFCDLESGTNFLNVARFPKPESFTQVLQYIQELASTDHEYKTFVVDTLDALEALNWDEICKEKNWKSIKQGDWGSGYTYALDKWREFLAHLQVLRSKMNIILLAHSQVKSINDPRHPVSYDKHLIKLQQKAADLIKENVDGVFFATYEVHVKAGQDGKKGKAYGDGNRLIYTQGRPAFEAKSRYAIPEEIPLSWIDFEEARQSGSPDKTEDLLLNIKELIVEVKDDIKREQIKKHVKSIESDSFALTKALDRVREIIKQQGGLEDDK